MWLCRGTDTQALNAKDAKDAKEILTSFRHKGSLEHLR
jgi:hypothetical protein